MSSADIMSVDEFYDFTPLENRLLISGAIPMTDFNAKAINSVPRQDIIARSVIGDKTLALLSRAEGLNLLKFAEFERRTHGILPLDAENDVRDALTQGYGVDRIETMPDGTARAHVSKVVGLNYPTPAGQ